MLDKQWESWSMPVCVCVCVLRACEISGTTVGTPNVECLENFKKRKKKKRKENREKEIVNQTLTEKSLKHLLKPNITSRATGKRRGGVQGSHHKKKGLHSTWPSIYCE